MDGMQSLEDKLQDDKDRCAGDLISCNEVFVL
jgi:hypothetical protein